MSVPDVVQATPFIMRRDICRDFERASRLEWLETNHTGAYAMGTVAGVNTRRYHALLIASLKPPVDRYSIPSRVEEQVALDGKMFELATVQYPSAVQRHGFELLEEFRLDPFPRWRYQLDSAEIEKTICLLDKQQAVLVRYQTSRACRLAVRFFLSFRDYHSLTQQNSALKNNVKEEQTRIRMPYPMLDPSERAWSSMPYRRICSRPLAFERWDPRTLPINRASRVVYQSAMPRTIKAQSGRGCLAPSLRRISTPVANQNKLSAFAVQSSINLIPSWPPAVWDR